jgi:CelD/BcsL family acetyltransferase involved in cellulose biosynthesis
LLSPEFTLVVGEVRADARVAVWRDGAAAGFLAHHRRPGGFARPIGAPFCDYHALVGSPDLQVDGREALSGAGLHALRLNGLIDPHAVFAASVDVWSEGRRVVLSGAADLAGLAATTRNRVKNVRRYRRRLEERVGPARIVAPDRDQAAFDRLIGWKRAQIARTGVHDFLGPPWTRALMQRLFETREGAFQGLLINLYAGNELAAGHFGVQLNGHYHPWIGAVNPEFAACSPGSVHQWMAMEAMPGLGLHAYDLGPGPEAWKRQFANQSIRVGAGFAASHDLGGQLAGLREGVWRLPALGRIEELGRFRRRLDHIAAVELDFPGRVRGLANAVANYHKRLAARRPAAAHDGD